MKILVINCGSSTIKFQLYNMENKEVIAKGRCDKIGIPTSNIIYKNLRDNISYEKAAPMPSHKEAMEVLIQTLTNEADGVISSFDDIQAVGHRVAHGGDKFSKAELVTDKVMADIQELCEIAPLHNPGALIGIKTIKELAPNVMNVTVFDTAFHQTIPDYNYLYAIKDEYHQKYSIRKYGFHGTSYRYILERLTEILNKPKESINAIVCHLGGGASMCAIKEGKSYDTTMGFTPLEGLMMETRSGDIDPTAIITIMRKENLTPDEAITLLNKQSGRLGICGIGDHRELMEAANSGNQRAQLAAKMQINRNKKYIGGYMAELGRVDAIVFTGGIGENDAHERASSLEGMEAFGVKVDSKLNEAGSRNESLISTADSNVKVFVIPTDEEYEIAEQTQEVYKEIKG